MKPETQAVFDELCDMLNSNRKPFERRNKEPKNILYGDNE